MTVYEPCTPSVASRLRRNFGALAFIAALSFVIPACGDESSSDDPSNNSSNNNPANNNPGNNNPGNNNPGNNNPGNNNPGNNNPGNNNPGNNNPGNNNPGNNNPDPIAECEAACMTLGTECRDEFLAECPTEVVDQLIPGCQQACADENARAQITAVAGLPCATVVPLAIDGFGLSEACADEPDLCEAVTCDEGQTCDPADGECKPDAVDLCENVTCDEGQTCDPADGMCKGGDVDLCEGVTCDEGQACDPADGMCKEVTCADAYEPNNTSDTASALTAEDQTIDNLGICLADRDFYTFTLPAGQSAQIAFFFSHAVEDIDVRATVTRNGASTTLTSVSSSDDEYLGIAAGDTEATVLVEAYVFQDGGENLYSMRIDIDPEGGACNTSAQCAEGSFCTAEKVCQEIGPCTEDDDCPRGLACDTVTSECVDCLDDNDCGFFETCDVATNTCVECATDDDCFGGDVCSAGVCVECNANEQCDSGLCNDDNTCAECVLDDDCSGGEVCNFATNECVQCLAAADCNDGFTCLEETNTCAPAGCDGTPDNNDTRDTAQAIEPGVYDYVICGGESDWYTITVAEGDNLYIEVLFDDAIGDIDTTLYRGAETTSLDSSAGTRDNEYLVGMNLTAGTYTFQIRGFSGASNAYSLNVQVNPALDLCNTANPCDAGFTCTERQVCVAMGTCEADRDCAFGRVCDLLDNSCVECTSDDQCASGLCNPDGLCAECSTDDDCTGSELCSPTNICVECLDDTACTGGEVCNTDTFACVACNVDQDCGNGFICSQNVCLPGSCDGQADGNDTRATAEVVTAPLSGDYVICGNEQDWYTITVAEGDNLYITLTFLDDLGDIDTTLYRGAETTSLDSSASSRDNEYLVGMNLAAGTYTWQVRGFLGATNVYGMTVEINPELPLCNGTNPCDAGFTCSERQVCVATGTCEEVRDCSSTQECSGGICIDCVTDDDCSGSDVCTLDGECVECLTGDQCDSNLCLQDNTCAECSIDDDCSGTETCSIFNTCVPAGCTPDIAETNDTRETAFSIDENAASFNAEGFLVDGGSPATLNTCDGTNDFYSIELAQGQTVTANIFFTHAMGDIEMSLQNSAGTSLDSSTSSSDNEDVSYTATTAGTYYIRVYTFGGANNTYTLQVNVQ